MRKFLVNILRRVILCTGALWLLAMLGALVVGPFVASTSSDAWIYRVEVLWVFLIPAIGVIYRINPKGVFDRTGVHCIKGLKKNAIYVVCVVVLTVGGFSIINAKHSEQYILAIREGSTVATESTIEDSLDHTTIPNETLEEVTQTDKIEKTHKNILKVETTESIDTQSIADSESSQIGHYVGKEGCTFSVSGSFDCDEVIYEIYSVKIKSDKDSESPNYNYYEIFFDFIIQNNRSDAVNWNLAYNGNLYGYLCHRGAERSLGGNSNIKDDDFSNMKLLSSGTLASGDSIEGYRSLVCTPDLIDFPEETWPLYSDEPFDLVLHLVVDDIDYELTIHFNQ